MLVNNESMIDRIIRGVVGAALIVAALFFTKVAVLAIVFGVAGLVLVVTGAVGFCPIYAGLRISTRKEATE